MTIQADDAPDFLRIIDVLAKGNVHFLVVGGVAANLTARLILQFAS
jgi:hypothetical protein